MGSTRPTRHSSAPRITRARPSANASTVYGKFWNAQFRPIGPIINGGRENATTTSRGTVLDRGKVPERVIVPTLIPRPAERTATLTVKIVQAVLLFGA